MTGILEVYNSFRGALRPDDVFYVIKGSPADSEIGVAKLREMVATAVLYEALNTWRDLNKAKANRLLRGKIAPDPANRDAAERNYFAAKALVRFLETRRIPVPLEIKQYLEENRKAGRPRHN